MKLKEIKENREVVVIDREKETTRQKEPKTPPMYAVLLHNDDYVAGEIIAMVLQEVFGHNTSASIQIMLKCHREGVAAVGTFAKDMADTKAAQAVSVTKKFMNEIPNDLGLDGNDVSSQLFTVKAA
jgi:ATP-dependent Clp protease adaptor protein ClpS